MPRHRRANAPRERMRYEHRDRANKAIPVFCALVLAGLVLALVAGGESLGWGVRGSITGVLGLAMLVVAAAVPKPESRGWLLELAGFVYFALWPPAAFYPHRVVLGALLLAGLLALLVWHARQKRRALWSKE